MYMDLLFIYHVAFGIQSACKQSLGENSALCSPEINASA
jgi:hypothetical protein